MTDTDAHHDPNPAEPCDACHQDPGVMEGLCPACYWANVDEELSCDWLTDEEPQP